MTVEQGRSPDVRQAIARQNHRMLRPVSIAGVLIYPAILLAGPYFWEPNEFWPGVGAAILATGVHALAFLLHRAGRIPPARAGSTLSFLLLFGVLNTHVGASDAALPLFAANLGLVAIGTGVLILSWPGLAVVLVAAGADWFLFARPLTLEWTLTVLSSLVIASVVHSARIRSTTQMELLLVENAAQQAQLVAALDELQRTYEQAVTREKLSALGTLVAGVAHEINNPLTYMRGNVELSEMRLREAAQEERALAPGELADIAEQQAAVIRGLDRIEHIVTSLRRIARSSGTTKADEDINTLVDSVLTVANARMPGSLQVVRDLRARSLSHVNASDISQVVLNLVLNAIEAMPEGGTLHLATRDEQGHVVVEVSDTGPGIPEEVRARMFTPFFTTKPTGTGLGLSISHRLVDQNGGTIALDRAPGGGALFRVTLPAARPSSPPVHAQGS